MIFHDAPLRVPLCPCSCVEGVESLVHTGTCMLEYLGIKILHTIKYHFIISVTTSTGAHFAVYALLLVHIEDAWHYFREVSKSLGMRLSWYYTVHV